MLHHLEANFRPDNQYPTLESRMEVYPLVRRLSDLANRRSDLRLVHVTRFQGGQRPPTPIEQIGGVVVAHRRYLLEAYCGLPANLARRVYSHPVSRVLYAGHPPRQGGRR